VRAFKIANAYKRGVETRREDVMQQLLGKDLNLSPEATFKQIQRWAGREGGDFAKLSQAIRSLPDEEANAARGTVITMLGRANDGAQNSIGTQFSPITFATQWNKMSPRAKAVLFQGEHRAALDDIAGVATGMKRADRYNNNSNTGVMVGGAATAGTFLANMPLAVASVLGQVGAGAVLGSTRVAKWLAALTRKPNEKAALAHIARLDNVAKAEPVIANEVLQLQTRLREAFSQGQMQAAANPESGTEAPLPPARTTTAGASQ
jgi:hypothetical protein